MAEIELTVDRSEPDNEEYDIVIDRTITVTLNLKGDILAAFDESVELARDELKELLIEENTLEEAVKVSSSSLREEIDRLKDNLLAFSKSIKARVADLESQR